MDDSLTELENTAIKAIEDFEASQIILSKNNNINNEFNPKQEEKNKANPFITANKSTNKITIFTKDEINLIDSNKTFEKISTVVKELIENSIDAGAKCVSVFIQNGGLDKIEVTDDGTGIPVYNLKNLCKRYTTTKASDYDRDMKSLKTLGYRGEALSILSYNSNLKITTKLQDSDLGYEVTYKNGNIFLNNFHARNSFKDIKDNRNSVDFNKIKSGAINLNSNNSRSNNDKSHEDENENLEQYFKVVNCPKGTSILVEQLFYNNLIRRKSMEQSAELKEIVNLISKFALHFHEIDFILTSNTTMNKVINTKLMRTQIKSELESDKSLSSNEEKVFYTKKEIIAKLFSKEASDNLFHFNHLDLNIDNLNGDDQSKKINANLVNKEEETDLFFKKFKFDAYFTKPSANLNKNHFIIFVNDRLVFMPSLQNLVEQIYTKFLIKHGKFFGYVNLKCAETDIDYNVKANKSEVYLREEKRFFDFFTYILEKELSEEIASKNYYISQYNNFGRNSENKKSFEFSNTLHNSQINDSLFYAKDKVRVDNKTIDINKYFKHKLIVNNKIQEEKQRKESENIEEEEQESQGMEECYDSENNKLNKKKIKVLSNSYKELKNEASVYIAKLIAEKFYAEENTNNFLSEVIRNCYYIGFEETNAIAFIQYETSLFIINLEFLFYEVILHRILTQKGFKSVKLEIESNFDLLNLIKMVEENFAEEMQMKDEKKPKTELKSIKPILNQDFNLDQKLKNFETIMNQFIGIKFNKKNSIIEISFIDLFEGNISYENFIKKIPFLNYSLLKEILEKNEKENNSVYAGDNNSRGFISNNSLNKNKNSDYDNYYLSEVYEFIKIYVFYLSKFYIDYFKDDSKREENDLLLKNFLFSEIKNNGFLVRKNVKPNMIVEKLIDTETLYTVFERC